MIKVVIRADASLKMGSGHVMRCLTLAGELKGKGADVSFICRELPGDLCRLIENNGYIVYRLPYENGLKVEKTEPGYGWEADAHETTAFLEGVQGADWLIVDNYALDVRWESRMRGFAKKIMIIDDLADRPHDCDLLLDQNLYKNMEVRYEGLVPKHCRKLLGPGFALLRREFREARKNLRTRDGNTRRILIFFGGSDPTNETAKALEAVRLLNRTDIAVDVVVGGNNPHKDTVGQICSVTMNSALHCQVENMAELMAKADLAIGAGGSATWERCFLGLPAITVIVAQNQSETTAAVAEAGAAWLLGWHNEVSGEKLRNAIERAVENPAMLREIGKRVMELMAGLPFDRDSLVLQALLEGSHVRA